MKTILTLIVVFLTFSFIYAQETGGPYTIDENTVLLMHFDGNATNSSAVGNNGIVHGTGVSYETGIHGHCLRLDNSTSDKQSWIEVPFYDELNSSEEFSVECWFKINSWGDDANGSRILFKKEASNGALQFETILYAKTATGQVNLDCVDDETGEWGADAGIIDILELNKWYHLVMYFKHEYKHVYCLIRDENFKEIYAASGYSETPAVTGNGKFMIGFGGWNESALDCCIDEVRISNIYRKYRDDVLKNVDTSSFQDSVFIKLNDTWTVYQWPLWVYYPVNNETGNRDNANSCGPTMLMRTIHFWEYPRFPSGVMEFEMFNASYFADFENAEYKWDLIPGNFTSTATEAEYAPAALFSVHVGTASMKFFDSMYAMPKFLQENFLFSKKTRVLFEDEYSKEEWENIIKNELNHGRPVMVGGVSSRSATGGGGHYYIINGYNSKNEFFTDFSFNDFYWKDLSEFDYGISQDIIIYMEPDWGDKTLELLNPAGGKTYKAGTDIEIKWTAESISNLIIEYSSDGGKNWQVITDKMDASAGKIKWTIPDDITVSYKVRISDTEDLNVYRKTGMFEVYAQKTFSFEYPKQNTNFRKGTRQPVYWQSSGINTFKLEYSPDNQTWVTLCDSVNAKDGFVLVDLPDNKTDNIVLKATDWEDTGNSYLSENFNFISEQLWGGPYTADDKTLLLMHFENKVHNEACNQLIPNELNPIGIYTENYNKNMGRAFRLFNPDNQTADAIHVKNSENIDLGNNWTMESWVKVASIMGERTVASLIINKWDAFNIGAGWQHFGGAVYFENGSSVEFYHSQEYNLNEWYHVVMISNAAEEKVYFYVHDKNYNQIFKDVKNFPAGSKGQIVQNGNLLTIGGLGGGSNLELDGYLDELRITKEAVDYSSMVVGTNDIQIQSDDLHFTIYPNPVTSETMISFETQSSEKVNLSVYDIQGLKICTLLDEKLYAGMHIIQLGNQIKSSGIYFCRLSTEKGTSTIKLIVK